MKRDMILLMESLTFHINKDNLDIVAPKTVFDGTVNESLDVIRELVDICQKYDINLILFTTIYYANSLFLFC